MTGEPQHAYAIGESDVGPNQQDKAVLPKHLEARQSSISEPRGIGGARFTVKNKEHTQREAVIRPRQAGKIDFKSLQKQPKFFSDKAWASNKMGPQSPSGKGRSRDRDKGRKPGRAERSSPQQLYRLSGTNPRSTPTIGIAYPQQKAAPARRLEACRGGQVLGSYRFRVPSAPEQEAELRQTDLQCNRSFQEAPSALPYSNCTPQVEGVTLMQQPGPLESNGAPPGSQLLLPEFQINKTGSWPPLEKTLNGAIREVSSQKQSLCTEGSRSNSSLISFQDSYPSLQDPTVDPFPCHQGTNPQEYLDISLAATQRTHDSFNLHSSGEGGENLQTNNQFGNGEPEKRSTCSQSLQYLQSPHGVQSSFHCCKDRNENPPDSKSSECGPQQLEQNNSSRPDNKTILSHEENKGMAPLSVNKTICPSKDNTANQRTHAEGNIYHARNIAQAPDSHVHFSSKAYSISLVNNMHVGSVPFDSSIPGGIITNRPLHTWKGSNKTLSSLEQNSITFSTATNKYEFQGQSAPEQRQHVPKNYRPPWEQIHVTAATPNQNRIELARQLSNQKLTFPTVASDWQDANNLHKNGSLSISNNFLNRRVTEGFTDSRQESTTSVLPMDNGVATSSPEDSNDRNKSLYFSLKQPLARASFKTSSHVPLQTPPLGLMSPLPCDSPLHSPIQNSASSSTCSSLSPTSTSPVTISSEDGKLPMARAPLSFYPQNQGKMLVHSDRLHPYLHNFHTDIFQYDQRKTNADTLGNPHDTKYSKPTMDYGKGCMDSFTAEHHPLPPPPPSYSAHQLLASSLSTANLDQLDVVLTCKQCDQNFNNLATFLDHKQYCGQHALTPSHQFKDASNLEENLKFQIDPTKSSLSGCEQHFSMLGLNKNGELVSDNELKADLKDDPLKLGLFAGTSALPGSLPDLEMDDAKLDSLITEALNGLGYQSDNAEIDSSFIDAFADDELTTVKVTGSGHKVKSKDSIVLSDRGRPTDTDEERTHMQGKILFDVKRDSLCTENKNTQIVPEKTIQGFNNDEKAIVREVSCSSDAMTPSLEQFTTQTETSKGGDKGDGKRLNKYRLPGKSSDKCRVKFQEASSSNQNSPLREATFKDNSKRKPGRGTWSKELIHKIVQQKNKFHMLHVKGTKNLQFSLVMKRLTPAVQDPKFGEYDYVSDSDGESKSLKIASQGRLGHNHSKYFLSKENKDRDKGDEKKAILVRPESEEGVVGKVAEETSHIVPKQNSHCLVRRKTRRSSLSNEHNAPNNVFSASICSPKSTQLPNHSKESDLTVMSPSLTSLSDSFKQDMHERSQQVTNEETSPLSLQLPSKNTKRYSSAGSLLSVNKASLPSSKKLNSGGLESILEIAKSNLARCRGTSDSSQGQEPVFSIEESIEEYSAVRRDNRQISKYIKGTLDNVSLFGAGSKLLPVETAEVNLTDSQHFSKKRKSKIFVNEKSDKRSSSDSSAVIASVTLNQGQTNNSVVPKPTVGHSDDLCLCPLDEQETVAQKETASQGHILYPIELNPVKSPLQFDTSAMFADLTVAGYDCNLYRDIPVNHDGFSTFCSRGEKRDLFDLSYPPYLRQKTDEGPLLTDDLSDGTIGKNATFNITEDDLEIKRIVTELENKLQTAKQNSFNLLACELSKDLTSSSFSPLQVGHEMGNEQSTITIGNTVESFEMATLIPPTDSNLEASYNNPDPDWSIPFQFGLQEEQQHLHSPVHTDQGTNERLCVKEHSGCTHAAGERHPQSPVKHAIKGAHGIPHSPADRSEEKADNELYTENLMKSLEVISDSIFNKGSLTAESEGLGLSLFVNSKHVCSEHQCAGEKGVAPPAEEPKKQKSEKTDALLVPFKNTDFSHGKMGVISLQPRESALSSISHESKVCEEMLVGEKFIDVEETHAGVKVCDTDIELEKPLFIEGEINDHITILTETSLTEEQCANVLEDNTCSLKRHVVFSTSIKDNEENKEMNPMNNSVTTSSFVHDQFMQNEENSEFAVKNNCDSERVTEYLKVENNPVGWVLPDSDMTEEIRPVGGFDETHKDTPTRFNTPGHVAANGAVYVDRVSILGTPSSLRPCRARIATSGCELLMSEEMHVIGEESMATISELKGSAGNDASMGANFERKAKDKSGCMECEDFPEQTFSGLMMIPRPAVDTGDTARNDRQGLSPQNVPAASLSPSGSTSSSALSLVKSPGGSDNGHRLSMLNDFERFSPIGTKFDEPSVMKLSDREIPVTSGISDLSVSLPHMESQSSRADPKARTQADPPFNVKPEKLATQASNQVKLEWLDTQVSVQEALKVDPTGSFQNTDGLDELNQRKILDLTNHLDEYSDVHGALNETIHEKAVFKESLKDCGSGQLRWETALTCNDLTSPGSTQKGDRDSALSPASPGSTKKGDGESAGSPGAPGSTKKGDGESAGSPGAPGSTKKGDGESAGSPASPGSTKKGDGESAVCIFSPDVSVQNPCTKQGCDENSALDISNAILKSAMPPGILTDICHSPVKIIAYKEMHDGLLKKSEEEKPGCHLSLTEHDTNSMKLNECEAFQTSSVCPEEASGLLSPQIESLTVKRDKSKPNQAKANIDSDDPGSFPKKIRTKGKILCDVCSACFQTVPGLKRHKAIKHFANKSQSTATESITINHQGISAFYKTADLLERPKTAPVPLQQEVYSFPESMDSHVALHSKGDSNVEHETDHQKTHEVKPSGAKTKNSTKVGKAKMDNNGYIVSEAGKSDYFSDGRLNVLKTDILQAICSNFPNVPQESCIKPPENPDTVEEIETKKPESLLFKLTCNRQEVEHFTPLKQRGAGRQQEAEMQVWKSSQSPGMFGWGRIEVSKTCRENEMPRELFYETKQAYEQKPVVSSEESINREIIEEGPVEIKCEGTSCHANKFDPHACGFKVSSASLLEAGQVLEDLLDDETTFSKLFPRDEEMIRKKCARVYGKRNKKQSLAPHSSSVKSGTGLNVSQDNEQQHSQSLSDPAVVQLGDICKNETISTEDSIMLDICQKSTLKNNSDNMDYIADNLVHRNATGDGKELGIGDLSCSADKPIFQAVMEWGETEVLADIGGTVLPSGNQMSLKSEDSISSTPPHPLHLSDLICTKDNSPLFHNTDIQNLNNKFQLPETPLFESSIDDPGVVPVANVSLAAGHNVRAIRRSIERRGKKRIVGGLKPKDKQYKCKVCFTWFLTLGELNFHKLSHNPSPPPTCYMCVQRKFSSREQLRDHLREKHAKNKAGIWTCGMCLKEISDVWMYNEHLREHATQFARKGQTQSSILGLPGCFMQETAVKNFITSIMQHRPSKSSRETAKQSLKDAEKTIKENEEQELKTKEGDETTSFKTKGGGKRSAPSAPEALPRAEASQKSSVIHPNCKDPSRDCHHCGKQFPKPFKLQRHLVVHSLQKIFLCHRCPVFYQDVNELKYHFKSEHDELKEELYSKHTTLYTCELCANVMHVIKKSFICSTCNYTFSKKEQFDRHMEKHLVGGNEILKFRGVVRPSMPFSSSSSSFSKDEHFDLSPCKRRKILVGTLPQSCSEGSIGTISSLQVSYTDEMHSPRPKFTQDSVSPATKLTDTSFRMDDNMVSKPTCFSPAVPKRETREHPSFSKLTPATELSTCETDGEPLIGDCDFKAENELFCGACPQWDPPLPVLKDWNSSDKTDICVNTNQPSPKDITLACDATTGEKTNLSQSSGDHNESCADRSSMAPKVPKNEFSTETAQEEPDSANEVMAVEKETKKNLDCVQRNETNHEELKVLNGQREVGLSKEKALFQSTAKFKPVPDCSLKAVPADTGATDSTTDYTRVMAFGRSEEKDLVKQQKKRKETKTSPGSKAPASVTRENLDVKTRIRKRVRIQSPGKYENTEGHGKAESASDYPVLSSVRDDLSSNKILPKPKAGAHLQPKKNTVDGCAAKKAENERRLNNISCKRKKGASGRPPWSPASKTSISSLNGALNKYRPLSGVRSVESQSHLLSQLFGQKLTSFKIPLRKDNESLN